MIPINRITILRSKISYDDIFFHTDLPNGCWPYDDKAVCKMNVAHGTGKEYCMTHFPKIPIEVIDI